MGEPALAVSEGAYAPEPGKIAIRDTDGSVSKIPLEDLSAAQGEGARPATEAEYFGAQKGTGGQVASAAIGAARTATFGLSDKLYVEGSRALGGDEEAEVTRHALNLAREANPDATFAGEVAGMALPALAGGVGAGKGGLSLVERAIGTSAAETSGLARAGIRAASVAPRAFVEGAAVGAGQQLSEDTLRNHTLAAENYLSAGFKGGMLGVLLGGVAAAGGGAVADKTASYFGRPAQRAESTLVREAGAVRAEEGSLKALEDFANQKTFKGATGARTGDLRRLGDAEMSAEATARIGKTLRSEVTAGGLPLTGPTVSLETSAKRIAERASEVGKELPALWKSLDKAATRPEMATIATRFSDEVAAPRLALPLGEAEVGAAQSYLQGMLKKGGTNPSFETLYGYRRDLDRLLKTEYGKAFGAPAKVGADDMRALRGIVDEELMIAADKASVELGGEIGNTIRLKSALYKDLATARDFAQKNAALANGNATLSLTDVIAFSHGGPAGMALGAANMVRRKLGDQIAGHVLDKVSRLEAVQSAASKIDALLNQGTKAFVANSGAAGTRAPKAMTVAEVRAARDAVTNPSAVQARVAEAVGDTAKVAPKVAQAMALSANRAAAWLGQSLPKEHAPTSPVFTGRPAQPMSDTDLLRARNILETVEDPTIVLDRLRQGRLTTSHVQTLKITSPETFLKIQSYIRDHAAEMRPSMTVQQQVSLSMLFETPVTEAMLPANIRAFQASFVQGSQAPGQGGTGGGGAAPTMSSGPIKGGGHRATAWDRQESSI
jgi:hypothetical protein